MKIAVIGAGAMGSLFGGYLSSQNEVLLVDNNEEIVRAVAQNGLTIQESDGRHTFHPTAVTSSEGLPPVDLLILFVKSMYTEAALAGNKGLIGPDTLVLTLQNGAGHEHTLSRHVPPDQILIGSTQHNASVQAPGIIFHGGGGMTTIGRENGVTDGLSFIAKAFSDCGFETHVSGNVRAVIWEKLMLNASASSLTGVLQVKLGFLADSKPGWALVETLVREAVAVANAEGQAFDAEKVLKDIHYRLEHSREGITSICADLRDGRKTEVDTISGAVAAAARRTGTPAPTHEAIVALVHALEDRNDQPNMKA